VHTMATGSSGMWRSTAAAARIRSQRTRPRPHHLPTPVGSLRRLPPNVRHPVGCRDVVRGAITWSAVFAWSSTQVGPRVTIGAAGAGCERRRGRPGLSVGATATTSPVSSPRWRSRAEAIVRARSAGLSH
jgi:hypothetical protein